MEGRADRRGLCDEVIAGELTALPALCLVDRAGTHSNLNLPRGDSNRAIHGLWQLGASAIFTPTTTSTWDVGNTPPDRHAHAVDELVQGTAFTRARALRTHPSMQSVIAGADRPTPSRTRYPLTVRTGGLDTPASWTRRRPVKRRRKALEMAVGGTAVGTGPQRAVTARGTRWLTISPPSPAPPSARRETVRGASGLDGHGRRLRRLAASPSRTHERSPRHPLAGLGPRWPSELILPANEAG